MATVTSCPENSLIPGRETSRTTKFGETSQTTHFFEKSSKILRVEFFKSGSFVRSCWLKSKGFQDNQWPWPDFFADYEYLMGTLNFQIYFKIGNCSFKRGKKEKISIHKTKENVKIHNMINFQPLKCQRWFKIRFCKELISSQVLIQVSQKENSFLINHKILLLEVTISNKKKVTRTHKLMTKRFNI